MFKLNFEKTVIFVLILILCVSTVNIFGQYISMYFNQRERNEVHPNVAKNISFPAMILKADQYYKQEMFKEAQGEYLKLTSLSNLSTQQKATVYFKLGVCNYKLKEYDLARDSFLKSTEYNTNDPVAYNNAAVSSFYLNELEKAEELQKKAVASLPVVEYHYNLARIYEDLGRYTDSVRYYTAVVKGEDNLTREDRIDPVRIKNKVMKLFAYYGDIGGLTNELMIALKLKEAREVFIIEDVNMDIKNKNFEWRIAKQNGIDRLFCSYDLKKSDPYNLINSLKWIVRRDGTTVFTSNKSEFSLSLVEGNNYIVYLDIDYGTNKQVSSYADVMRSKTIYSSNVKPILSTSLQDKKPKYYEYAVYEQIFERNFDISEKGYVDRFDAIWGKDEVETKIMDKDFIDAQGALYIKNEASGRAGIWADLSSLIEEKKLRGKTIGIRFYSRKVSPDANMYVSIRTKIGKEYKNSAKKFELEYKWKQISTEIFLPDKANGLTISFRTDSDEEIKIDGFIITVK